MKLRRLAQLFRYPLAYLGVTIVLVFCFAQLPNVWAQTFIQPPAIPVGGNTSSWLTTGSAPERKLGPLLIGSLATPTALCLNSATTTDVMKCVTSWSQVVNLAGGPFVPLRTSGLAVANQSDPNQYFSTPTATTLGASAIEGTGSSQSISFIVEANPDNNAGYGLFAGDDGIATNYAAQFIGKVGIGNTILASGLPGPAGQFCLNDTSGYIVGGATGCISAWSDLGGSLAGFVRLQSTNPPTPEAGTAATNETGNFATVVFGHPPVGQPNRTFCGDGMCSTHINEDVSANPNYCPIDCAPPNPPGALNIFQDTPTVNLQVVSQTQIPAGPVLMLLLRSPNQSFMTDLSSGFVPQNGVTYTTGQIINGVSVVFSGVVGAPSGFSAFDTIPPLPLNVPYYYRLYQANLFPIYNPNPKTVEVTPH